MTAEMTNWTWGLIAPWNKESRHYIMEKMEERKETFPERLKFNVIVAAQQHAFLVC